MDAMLAVMGFDDFLGLLVVNLFLTVASLAIAYAGRQKTKLARSTLDDIQIPTQAEGPVFPVIFGTPPRSAHSLVLYYGDLEIKQKYYEHQPVANYHYLTVHLGISRSGPEAVQQIWYKDVPMWPTLRDETASAADATATADMDDTEHFKAFGDWRRDGGFSGVAEILYGGAAQPEPASLQKALANATGTASLSYNIFGGYWTLSSATFATQPDGYWVGGTITIRGATAAVIYHSGDTIRANGGEFSWISGSGSFVLYPPPAQWVHGPAYRGILSIVFSHFYWGLSPIFGMVSTVVKRTQQLTDGAEMWYLAKADISGDLNPAHILRECLTESTWGEGKATTDLGTTWTTVADTLFTEGFGLSFRYLPEPGALQDFVELVLQHIDGYIYKDRTTGKIEIGLARDDYVLADLTEYDEGDFEIVDWHTPSWKDVPGRIVLKYGNRYWPDNGKTVTYDDVAVQAKQEGRVNEKVVERPGIFSDALAATVVNRLGRSLCRLLSVGTLRCKRTMADLHKGSVFKISYTDPDLSIVQMVVRVTNIKYGPLGDDACEIDVIEDVWGSAYTIYGAPGIPIWQPPPVDPDEPALDTLTATGTAAVSITGEGVGEILTGAADGLVTIGGEGVGETGTISADAVVSVGSESVT